MNKIFNRLVQALEVWAQIGAAFETDTAAGVASMKKAFALPKIGLYLLAPDAKPDITRVGRQAMRRLGLNPA